MSRILVTGGSGFLGSHLVERLEAAGNEVIAPRSAEYDLRRLEDAERLFRDAAPELVYHVAAVAGGIGANRAEPGRFWYENLLMGAYVLEQSRRFEARKVVMLGTICEYPKLTPVPFREEDLWNGFPEETNAPYGIAKKAQLVGGQAYRDQYGFDVVHLLPVNLYGPRDNFDLETSHVIPALIRKMTSGESSSSSGATGRRRASSSTSRTRPRRSPSPARRYSGREPVNLGSGEEISIRELAELVAEVTGFEGTIEWDTSKPNGQPRRKLDVSKARELFGFEARTTLRDGLERVVTWFRSSKALSV